MSRSLFTNLRSPVLASIAAATALAWAPPSDARVTKIIIDLKTSPAFCTGTPSVCPTFGDVGQYETLTGRAFGELDPNDPQNAEITDLAAAQRNANGKVDFVASFHIVKPIDMRKTSGLMWHDVPNRGGRINITSDLRSQGDVGLSSAWQGDNAWSGIVPTPPQQPNFATLVPPYANELSPHPAVASNEWVKVPVLAGVTGEIFGRVINRSGLDAQPLNVMGNPIPYFPVDPANNAGATLTTHLHETITGVVTEGSTIQNSDWKFCGGGTFAAPTPVTTLPVRLCLKDGFDPKKLYQLVYTVKDPYVLGAGTAAFRDLGSFFRYASAAEGNPLAGNIKWSIIRGSSQSGNFTRHFIHLGMNQDEAGRIVHEGAWPLIAGRRVANNSRWGQPDGVLELYQMGSEGPQWWHKFPDHVRDLKPAGILERCDHTKTCPKIVETFGGAEVFALKMTTSWVGTSALNDIPLPKNVRRYYLPSSSHGGGSGLTTEKPLGPANNVFVNCPGNNWGRGTLLANPVPATGMVNRMRAALRDWVMRDTPPPPSQWPMMKDKNLVEPTMKAMGFPEGIPGIPASIFLPENFVFPVLDYDWGPEYDHSEASGNPTNAPPPILHVIKTLVPRVDKDGNEVGGIPTVQNDAPLGTYLGWNITAGPEDTAVYDGRPFHKGQVCNYTGGMVPFFKTRAQRVAAGDPRLSLEERYGTHAGYVTAVTAAANNAFNKGYLLAADRDALIAQAEASDVLQ